MSTDRELLELAAKALGARPYIDRGWPGLCLSGHPDYGPFRVNEDGNGARKWNPLEENGDAFALAVELGIVVQPQSMACRAIHNQKWEGDYCEETLDHPRREDLYAAEEAMRRAIVRAAAEIGRSMP